MKNKNILTPLITAMFILSLFSAVTSADTPKEQYEGANEQYWSYKEKYDMAKGKFEDSKKQYETAKLKFRSSKANNSMDELENYTKAYLEDATDIIIAHLSILKYRVENPGNIGTITFKASDNINKRVTEIEDIRTKVQQAETPKEFVNSDQELRDLWVKIKLETNYYSGILINNRIGQFLVKVDNASGRMDAVIQRLKDQGKDTTKLEEEASSFNNLVNEIKENHESTLDLYANHKGFDSNGMVINNQDAQTFIQQSNNLQRDTFKKLKDANQQLRDFFQDSKKLIDEKMEVKGKGTLTANGNGNATIKGDVTVTLSADGSLLVSKNAVVSTDGKGIKEIIDDDTIKYQGFGSATISGENIRVEVSGNSINLIATGRGSAVLKGSGTYHTDKDFSVSGEWKKEGKI